MRKTLERATSWAFLYLRNVWKPALVLTDRQVFASSISNYRSRARDAGLDGAPPNGRFPRAGKFKSHYDSYNGMKTLIGNQLVRL
jgi:hypothetical protein